MIVRTLITAIISVVYVTGCTTPKPYRINHGSFCNYESGADCADQAMHITNAGQDNEYRLSFIEYDDQGQLQTSQVKSAVTSSYRDIAKEKGVLLITFIHGWHHNANGDPEDDNISSFREILEQVSKRETELSESKNKPPREVLGVYIGWRGALLVGFLDYLTFWDRKSTAHEVGYQGVTETLLEFEQIVKGDNENHPNNRMITIGHSFGGAALYSSLSSVMAERYISSRPFKTEKQAEGFGDLVLLLNPAFEALRHSSLYELSQDECRGYPKNQLPKLVMLSSKADKILDIGFQIGRYPSTLFESHRSTKLTYCTKNGEQKYPLNQWRADVSGIGHFEPYVTHSLDANVKSESSILSKKYSDPSQAWLNQVQSGSTVINFSGSTLTSKRRTKPLNPYMNIFTTKEVMAGHNDIWTDTVKSFVIDLISISVTN